MAIKNHLQLSDKQFKTAFQNCQLAPKLFNHEAHLRLAWLLLKEYGLEKGMNVIQTQILAFVDNLGATDKYNKTLTVAAVKAVHHFMGRSKAFNFTDFITEFPKLKHDFKGLMRQHYSFDIYNSLEAKTTFLKPDLQPF